MNPFIKKLLYSVLGLLTLATQTCVCTVTFADTAGNIALDTSNSSMYINNPAKVTGWGLRSVVKTYGDNASSAWPEGYNANAIVGLASQPNVTIATRTNLIDANSNAINGGGGSLLRTSSNLLLYVARTYSSSILVLNSRADSNNTNIRTTSNTINLFANNVAVPTTDSIDGTQFMRYHTAHHVFHNGASTIRGWVRFNDGFTVMPQGTVSMDTLTTVSGVIDLRDTGVLKLNNDLYLAHNVTLTAGGYIKGNAANFGQANTIFMGGDLTLASDSFGKVLHITGDWANNGQSGDTIIDGCGHTLTIGDWGQIFVDTNVTLTLRNMTIKTSPKSPNKPAIQLAALSSKLALDNVVFDLGSDFLFDQGQLFIHDDVAITGTSAFIYTSPKPSYITSGATWSFEQGTTFSIAPSTYTDQPFTAGTATSNNFIMLADQSAALSLNNCSLKTTFTGARFTKGMVLFDNKVALDTQAGSEISGLTTPGQALVDYSSTASCVALSPDGRYIAVGAMNGGSVLYVYPFIGNAQLGSYLTEQSIGGNAIPAVAWSPDGRFVAIGCDTGPQLRIYRFNGTSTFPNVVNAYFGLIVNSISWSPDGKYLAVGGNNSSTPLIIYRFDGGVSLTQVTTDNPGGTTVQINSVAWSPDGKYLVASARNAINSVRLQPYSFNGTTLSTVPSSTGVGNPCSVSWSPDGRFVAWGWSNGGTLGMLQIYRFNGTGGVTPVTQDFPLGNQVNAAAWSPDGRFIMTCGMNGGAGWYSLYRFNTASLSALVSGAAFGTVATTVAWSPDSKYVLIGGTNTHSSPNWAVISLSTTRQATAANTQGFSNGLLFGDKTKGVAFDANVQVLAGATIKVKGKIKDDSF